MGLVRRLGSLVAGFVVSLLSIGYAQSFLAGEAVDPGVPTVTNVLGSGPGSFISSPEEARTYFDALAAAEPDRVKLVPYGRTWQGRELFYVVLSSAENMARLDEIQEGYRRLADPRRTDPAAAQGLIDRLPGSIWLAYSVHGNEITSTDAAMMTAYHLLAATDERDSDMLEDTVVFIDPLQNPDGRARFVHHFYDTLGLDPSGSRIAAERNEQWPGGRYNHYPFDLNRDWFALTQPGTQGRVQAFLEWMPLVFIDVHEMGSDSTYYFGPEAEPYNPYITEPQRRSLEIIGRGNADYFDEQGFRYFTREVYDALFPGYGAAWPLYHGSIGTTYEQASPRGLLAEQRDGEILTFAQGLRQHFTASVASVDTVATHRADLLSDFYRYRRSAIEEGRTGEVRSFVVAPQADPYLTRKLVNVLMDQGIEVSRAESAIEACGGVAPGSFVVNLDQPAGRLVRTLLDRDIAIDAAFMAEQDRRRRKGLDVEIYDVTAWSLPLMYGVDVRPCETRVSGPLALLEEPLDMAGAVSASPADYGYLVPWDSVAAARFLAHAMRAGLDAFSADQPFTHGGQRYPAGTVIVPRAGQGEDLDEHIAQIARESGADAIGIAESWVTEGPGFGSANVVRHRAPRIAIGWDEPTVPTSAGGTRFVIERQLGYPVTPIRIADLTSDALYRFDVLILPDGTGYRGALGEDGTQHLRDWVSRGGVLIAMDRAARYVSDPEVGLSALRRERAAAPDEAESAEEEGSTVPGTVLEDEDALRAAIEPANAAPAAVLGALLAATPDPDHWLAVGLQDQLAVLASGSDIYAPIRQDQGTNVLTFAGADDLVLSGTVWPETIPQLAYKPAVTAEPLGRGHLIIFVQDPTVRAYLDGLNLLLANAVFRGPGHTSGID